MSLREQALESTLGSLDVDLARARWRIGQVRSDGSAVAPQRPFFKRTLALLSEEGIGPGASWLWEAVEDASYDVVVVVGGSENSTASLTWLRDAAGHRLSVGVVAEWGVTRAVNLALSLARSFSVAVVEMGAVELSPGWPRGFEALGPGCPVAAALVVDRAGLVYSYGADFGVDEPQRHPPRGSPPGALSVALHPRFAGLLASNSRVAAAGRPDAVAGGLVFFRKGGLPRLDESLPLAYAVADAQRRLGGADVSVGIVAPPALAVSSLGPCPATPNPLAAPRSGLPAGFEAYWASRALLPRWPLGNLTLVWDGYFGGCTGWASEAIRFVTPLERLSRITIVADEHFCPGLPASTRHTLDRLRTRDPGEVDIWISHKPPPSYPHFPYYGLLHYRTRPAYVIGRSMAEASRINDDWVARINEARDVDEVWVPSSYLVEVFEGSGVNKGMVRVVPEAVDVAAYDPAIVAPLADFPGSGYRFLSVFKWEPRKGHDVLLRAYFEEFSESDPVSLTLQTYLFNEPKHVARDPAKIMARIEAFAKTLGLPEGKRLPRVHVMADERPVADMPSLFRSADCFVLPTRGEGWGLPIIEAMAMGLPAIATEWSGQTDFMSRRNSLPLRVSHFEKSSGPGAVYLNNQTWAVADVKDLRRLLRWVFEHPEEAKELGAQARADVVARYSEEAVARVVLKRLAEIQAGPLQAKRHALSKMKSERDAERASAGKLIAKGPKKFVR